MPALKVNCHLVRNVARATFSFCLRSCRMESSRNLFNFYNAAVARARFCTKWKSTFKWFACYSYLIFVATAQYCASSELLLAVASYHWRKVPRTHVGHPKRSFAISSSAITSGLFYEEFIQTFFLQIGFLWSVLKISRFVHVLQV